MMVDVHVPCFHCGEKCPDEPVVFHEKEFCCHGCQQVYELLEDHALADYYTCDVNPGKSPSKQNFSFLDHPAFHEKLISFSANGISKVTFILPAIHCRSCLYLLENLHRLNEGISKSILHFGKKEITIWFKENELSLGTLANLLASLGYEPLVNSDETVAEKQRNARQSNQLLLKLGIAGFCAGNAMLFSFPEYLGIQDGSLKELFGYLNVSLGTLAVFYSGSDYIKNVWAHVKLGKMTIEMPILLGIMVGYFRSVYEVFSHTGAGYIDSVSGLLFFLLVGKWFQQKSFDFLSFERKYTSYFPLVVTKWLNGHEVNAPLEDIVIGDHLLIRNQEIIPADSILVHGTSNMDYSFVTGESEPMALSEGNSMYAGGKHQGNVIEIEIKKALKQSHLTQLWEQQAFKDPIFKSENWENFANTVGKYFTIGLISLATGVGMYWFWVDPSKWQNSVVSILVIACPCALAISYPFALGHGIRWLSKFKCYVKDIQSLERMSHIDTIVFDKTGTLTLANDQKPNIFFHRDLTNQEWNAMYTLVHQSTHPISRQAKKYLAGEGFHEVSAFENIREITGKGMEGNFGGQWIRMGSAKFVGTKPHAHSDFISSESQLYVQIDEEVIGYMEFPWQNREGIEWMLHQLSYTYDVYMLSGDKKENAASLLDWFPRKEQVKFECSPMDKMEFIQHLQAEGRQVAMVGDGLNDAGALRQSNVGIAISDDHLHFTPASDVILQGNFLLYLPKFLDFSRYGLRLIKASFVLSLVYNAIGLSFAIQGNLSPLIAAILMPVNSISMLVIANLGMNIRGNSLKSHIQI